MRDDRKELKKQIEIVLWSGLALLGLHLYVELHSFFADLGLASAFSDKIIGKFAQNPKLFGSPWTFKVLAGVCVSAYGFSNRGVKSTTLKKSTVIKALLIGLILYGGSTLMLRQNSSWFLTRIDVQTLSIIYLMATTGGILYLIKGTQGINRLLGFELGSDVFNTENESFPQEERKLENPDSINLRTEFTYKGKIRQGWINLTNIYRAIMVMGTPGSGKSFGVINSIIRQLIGKGFAMYVYDFKYPTLSLVALNAMKRNKKKLHPNLKFYCINFEKPEQSHRCNPIHPDYLKTTDDAYQSARTMLLNMNRKWIDEQGKFFVESPINYVTVCMWYLRCYKGGIYCTLPHLVELISVNYRKVFPLLMGIRELKPYMTPFLSALEGKAMEQLEGQISSAQIGLARLASPALYWAMSGNDFKLDINNPEEPKVLCLGNKPGLDDVYGAALGLYNFRILSLINREGQHKCSVIVDELPTIYFKGIDKLIATGRSNKISVTIAMQDHSQLEKDYGKVEAETIKNTCGTIISGQVTGSTAEYMEKRMGKNVQKKNSVNISEDTTHGMSTEMQPMMPAAKIGMLSQGKVCGVVADNEGQETDLKAFSAKIVVDVDDFKDEQKLTQMPVFYNFAETGKSAEETVEENFYRIQNEIMQLIDDETDMLMEKLKS